LKSSSSVEGEGETMSGGGREEKKKIGVKKKKM
jgi:hypothetical protein